MTQLDPESAVKLVFAIAEHAGTLVITDARTHIAALELVTRAYIRNPLNHNEVDWAFINRRVMDVKQKWADEDKARNKIAIAELAKSGYGALGSTSSPEQIARPRRPIH